MAIWIFYRHLTSANAWILSGSPQMNSCCLTAHFRHSHKCLVKPLAIAQLSNVTIRALEATGSTLQDGKELWCTLTAKEHHFLSLLTFLLEKLEDAWCFQGLLTTKAVWCRVALNFSLNINSDPILLVISVLHLGIFWHKVFWGQQFLHCFYKL